MKKDDSIIEIYTDGSCLKNPGNGGWAAILLYKNHKKEICGKESNTTNNRMELRAVIEALRLLKKSSEIVLYTDSQYVKEGITKWIFSWQKNGWKTAGKKPVKNSDLWQELDLEVKRHLIKWVWVRAHNGNHFNEKVDSLARNAVCCL